MFRCALGLATFCLMLQSGQPTACEWPDNWLGTADNSYRVLKIGVFYHASVLHDLADEEGNSPLPRDAAVCLEELRARPELVPQLMRLELARVRTELARAADFYWRNSRFNCVLDYDWIIDLEPRLRSSIANPEPPYFSPVDHYYYRDARNRYDGLLQIMVLYTYDKESDELQRVKGGGG